MLHTVCWMITLLFLLQGKARLLYKAGFKSLQEIAHCEPQDLVSKVDYMSRAQARQIKASATVRFSFYYKFNLAYLPHGSALSCATIDLSA